MISRTAKHASHQPLLPEPPVKQTRAVGEKYLGQIRQLYGMPDKPLSGWKQKRS